MAVSNSKLSSMAVRIKRTLTNLSVLAVTSLVLIVMAEILLRWYEPPALNRHHQQLFVQYDSDLGWSLTPGIAARHVTTEYTVTEHINSKGLRGPEYPYEKRPGERRILILGDSFAEGYSVNFEDLFSEVLTRQLKDWGATDVTVINAGTGGYSTDQEFLFFTNEGYKYNPDLTILVFYHNDILSNASDHYWRGFKPAFILANDRVTLTNVPVPKPRPDDGESSVTDGGVFLKAKMWLKAHSRLYAISREAVLNNYNLHLLAINLGLADKPLSAGPVLPIPDELKVWSTVHDTMVERSWQITEALLGALKHATSETNSDLMVFYAPVSAAVYEQEWKDTQKRYGLSDSEWCVNQAARDLEAVCLRHNIRFLDPTSQFIERKNELVTGDRRLYYPLDRHWTAEGHQLTAKLLSGFIYRNYQAWFSGPVPPRND